MANGDIVAVTEKTPPQCTNQPPGWSIYSQWTILMPPLQISKD